jgi:hypothetical protein
MQQAEALPEAEWNFRELIPRKPNIQQEQELHAAIRYEYARESQSIRDLAAKFADLSDDEQEERGTLTYPKPAKSNLYFFTIIPFWNCILWPRFFPNTPWLSILPQERTRRVQSYMDANPPKPYLQINELEGLEEWLPKKGRRMFVDLVEHLILCIDWSVANNSEIISAFAYWVRKSRPPSIREPRGDASRLNVNSRFLTCLAVMRLLHRYPFQDARNIALDHNIKMPARQSNALRMRHEVASRLRKIFRADLFEGRREALILSGELPLSWSTVTEQQRQSHRR